MGFEAAVALRVTERDNRILSASPIMDGWFEER
jgi:hypothetical protein